MRWQGQGSNARFRPQFRRLAAACLRGDKKMPFVSAREI